MMPEQTVTAAGDLGAAHLLPAHVGKFTLVYHPWDEPFRRISEAGRNKSFRLVTPVIGEAVGMTDRIAEYPRW